MILEGLKHDGSFIWTDGITLGGDDGIAVAMAPAVLEADNITHPALECIFTTDEEIGMTGASALDMSGIEGNTPGEKLDIKSTERVYEFLLNLPERL